jgi:hypothetical protein
LEVLDILLDVIGKDTEFFVELTKQDQRIFGNEFGNEN